ncbi:MAG TPA: SH3 domain-containing protein [Chloroflexota bacterium]|nr:SH3 domain-containing protein [Chloroflexota bacterium]
MPFQRAWNWFDRLGDLQTAALLVFAVIGLGCLSVPLFSIGLSEPTYSATPVETIRAAASPAAPFATPTAQVEVRAKTAPIGVNLRRAPSPKAALIVTLPPSTEVEILGDPTPGDDGLWQHVRTGDGLDGWMIASALE